MASDIVLEDDAVVVQGTLKADVLSAAMQSTVTIESGLRVPTIGSSSDAPVTFDAAIAANQATIGALSSSNLESTQGKIGALATEQLNANTLTAAQMNAEHLSAGQLTANDLAAQTFNAAAYAVFHENVAIMGATTAHGSVQVEERVWIAVTPEQLGKYPGLHLSNGVLTAPLDGHHTHSKLTPCHALDLRAKVNRYK